MAPGMTDTTADELGSAIDVARADFIRLCRRADPTAPVLDGHWNVLEMTAHVATVSRRYVGVAEGSGYRRAESPRDVDRINDDEVAANHDRSLEELLQQLEADAPTVRSLVEAMEASGRRVLFHGGASVDAIGAAASWLGELRIHGWDIAQAGGERWPLPERDMLMVLSGIQQLAPGYLDPARAAGRNLMVEARIPTARPWVTHVHDGVVESRPRRRGDRPHAVLRVPASVFALSFYRRIGPLPAAWAGLRIVGGSRPWRAVSLLSMFERP